ncbi:hypothetical protein CROQUDRAFT_95686 [Cronartium quercuum f. sp. fusiforme G11]|uniref:Uncharacterized protein n=1 Tax=Cronartium quercuum f. sp. fusiforme G11 TaxID=708437 RepID=A0A9P6T980_9BASI|nr:hypothetical protein CROQUDRAFT_95686 [Cronartium quercuum f. sp. fusiforme G11]
MSPLSTTTLPPPTTCTVPQLPCLPSVQSRSDCILPLLPLHYTTPSPLAYDFLF